MGLLGDIFSAGNTAKRRLRGLLDDPIGSMQQAVDNAFPTRYEAQNAISQLRGQQYNPDALQAYNTKLDSAAMNFAPMGMTVWHGSPHKFSKFDMSKIGTGEGAQAYGHGLYVGEAKAVGEEYKRALAGKEDGYAGRIAANAIQRFKTPERAISHLEGQITPNVTEEGKAVTQQAIDLIKQGKNNQGYLYKVDIPDEAVARFLDWDKKLADQIPEVQAVAKQWNNGTLPSGISSGDELLRYIQQQLGFIGSPKKAEQILKEAGVPGIKYLDGGSRSSGQGSSNFVLFDDQLPRILETNGVPTGQVPWKPGEWQGLLGGGR